MDREQIKAIKPEEFQIHVFGENPELWCPGYREGCPGPDMQANGETLSSLLDVARDHIQRWHDTSI